MGAAWVALELEILSLLLLAAEAKEPTAVGSLEAIDWVILEEAAAPRALPE